MRLVASPVDLLSSLKHNDRLTFMVNQLKQTKTARTAESKLCNKREESGR